MSDTINFSILIPSDDDGFILCQCEYCGSYFKCTASDMECDGVLFIYCPCCGLISDNYFTEDVIKLAHVKMENYASDITYRTFKNSMSKAGSLTKPKHKNEKPIRFGVDELEVMYYPCCN